MATLKVFAHLVSRGKIEPTTVCREPVTLELIPNNILKFGRKAENEIYFQFLEMDHGISREHGLLTYKKATLFGTNIGVGGLVYKDTSRNGTWYLDPGKTKTSEAKPIKKNEEIALQNQCYLLILEKEKQSGYAFKFIWG